LQQDAFSEHDYTCPLWKTAGMMKCICHLYNGMIRAIAESDKEKENKITLDLMKSVLREQINNGINLLKFDKPTEENKDMCLAKYDQLCRDIDNGLKKI